MDSRFVENLASLIRRLASETLARRVSSGSECRFCDITADDCPDRIDGEIREEEIPATSKRSSRRYRRRGT